MERGAAACEEESGWRPLPAREDERWLLAAGAVGWIEEVDRARLWNAAAELAELREQIERATAERQRLVSAARDQGLEEGRALVTALLSRLVASRESDLRRMVDAVIECSRVVVGIAVIHDDASMRMVIERALASTRAEDVLQLRVAPELVESMRKRGGSQWWAGVEVRPDAELGAGDVVVIRPDGQQALRLSTILESMRFELDAMVRRG